MRFGLIQATQTTGLLVAMVDYTKRTLMQENGNITRICRLFNSTKRLRTMRLRSTISMEERKIIIPWEVPQQQITRQEF